MRTPLEVAQAFLTMLTAQISSGETSPKTHDYYDRYLRKWLARLPADVATIADLKTFHLYTGVETRHELQTVQRLFNWAQDLEYIEHNPFRKIKLPPPGQRERTLTPKELASIMRQLPRPARRFVSFMRHTIMRPGEVCALNWSQVQTREVDGKPRLLFVLEKFKAKRRRRDRLTTRYVPIDPFIERMLKRMRPNPCAGEAPILVNRIGQRWRTNALAHAFRKAAKKVGLLGPGLEAVVPYTIRHTGATVATENGIRDRMLADIMGHSSTRTTARYQHLDTARVAEAIRAATSRPKRGPGAEVRRPRPRLEHPSLFPEPIFN